MNMASADTVFGFSSVVDVLRWRAEHQPHQLAYTFLAEGEAEETTLTYEELDRQARAIGTQLIAIGATGQRALLLYPPGLSYVAAFLGCLYGGVVAVPAYPPRLNRSLPRLQRIVADAQAMLALTTLQIRSDLTRRFTEAPDLGALMWLATDSSSEERESDWRRPDMSRDTLAFLQYTSGSTAAPKGVMVSHGNILENERAIQRAFEHTTEDIIAGWLPLYHDMGLIGNMLQPLYVGASCVLMSPVAFLQKPVRWLQAISDYKVTTSGAPNFAYDLCLRKVTPEQRAGLDLSRWGVAFCGAEPVRHETCERFAAAFECCGFRPQAFYPCYGLAEATLIVSGGKKRLPPVSCRLEAEPLGWNQVVEASENSRSVRTLVGCGQSVWGQKVCIVDPETDNYCPADGIGEIWVSGPSVAQGYWNQPEETARVFHAHTANTGEGPFLRTGDLGFFKNGDLFLAGRMKDLIIIRGRNYYPHDMEVTAGKCHPALRPDGGAAFSIEEEGGERLVIVQEVERHFRGADVAVITDAIRQAIAEQHELQTYAVVLVKPGAIPRTSSGKVKRYACRQMFIEAHFDAVGSSVLGDTDADDDALELLPFTRDAFLTVPPDEGRRLLEAYLVRQVARLLKVAPSRLDPHLSIADMGLDSLMTVALQHRMEADIGVVLPMTRMLESASLADLASEVFVHPVSSPPLHPITSAVGEGEADEPLSVGQRSLWFVHQLRPDNVAYNIVGAVQIDAGLDAPALRRAFQALLDRHPVLRTAFSAPHGEPMQQAHEHETVSFQEEDGSDWSQARLKDRLTEEANRPFDLERGPLLRVFLFWRPKRQAALLLAVHHIVADLWSVAVLMRELGVLYAAETSHAQAYLAVPRMRYTDYVHWQAEMLSGPEGERLWNYWREQLAGELPVLNLPTDNRRPPVQTYRGALYTLPLDNRLSQRVRTMAEANGVTLFTILLAAFQVMLHRYSDQEHILVGSPTAGRSRAAFAELVGYFVNPVVMRADLSGDPTFITFLHQAHASVRDALAHQEFPFAALVERVQPARDPSRSPLFQVLFALQKAQVQDDDGLAGFVVGQNDTRMNVGGLPMTSIALERRGAQFDLSLSMAEIGGELSGSFQYSTDLFEASTIERMADHFRTLLEGIVANPERRLSELPMIGETERHRVLVEWNDTQRDYPPDMCLHELIEAQVERTPNDVAVVFEGEELTYSDLNRRANQLARHLQALGVGPETLVALCIERSLEMVVGLLGVLKAGGAYVPLDPDYPRERLAFMLSDAQAPVLLTQEHLLDTLPEHGARVLCLDRDWSTVIKEPADNPECAVRPENLAYVIYTSGSTGRPKGVMNTHRGICNRLLWMQDAYRLTRADCVLQKTPFSFDVSVWEFFWPLLAGARLAVARPGGHKDPSYLSQTIRAQKITTLHFVPSMLSVFLEDPGVSGCDCLTRVICSGEALSVDLQERFFGRLEADLHNLYGPTEAAVDVTFWACRRGDTGHTVPIGRPIANTRIYLLDRNLQPVPIGVPGEIHIGGVGVARGYVNLQELTAQKFIADPFSDESGARLYKTGDLARYLPDSNIEFLGRTDHQVKIRGFRVELEEIEAVLEQHASVQAAVVLVRDTTPGNKGLVAYLINDQMDTFPLAELRSFLKQSLPDYMIPSAFIFLDAFPLTPNGKIDRQALPEPDAGRPELEEDYVGPRSSVEEAVAAIWAEVLEIDRVGMYDNFFDLGGHSLLATQVLTRVRDRLGVELPLSLLFTTAFTVADLAQAVEEHKIREADAEEIAALLQQLEGLSDDEVRALLDEGKPQDDTKYPE